MLKYSITQQMGMYVLCVDDKPLLFLNSRVNAEKLVNILENDENCLKYNTQRVDDNTIVTKYETLISENDLKAFQNQFAMKHIVYKVLYDNKDFIRALKKRLKEDAEHIQVAEDNVGMEVYLADAMELILTLDLMTRPEQLAEVGKDLSGVKGALDVCYGMLRKGFCGTYLKRNYIERVFYNVRKDKSEYAHKGGWFEEIINRISKMSGKQK